jgi:hypothetical protein
MGKVVRPKITRRKQKGKNTTRSKTRTNLSKGKGNERTSGNGTKTSHTHNVSRRRRARRNISISNKHALNRMMNEMVHNLRQKKRKKGGMYGNLNPNNINKSTNVTSADNWDNFIPENKTVTNNADNTPKQYINDATASQFVPITEAEKTYIDKLNRSIKEIEQTIIPKLPTTDEDVKLKNSITSIETNALTFFQKLNEHLNSVMSKLDSRSLFNNSYSKKYFSNNDKSLGIMETNNDDICSKIESSLHTKKVSINKISFSIENINSNNFNIDKFTEFELHDKKEDIDLDYVTKLIKFYYEYKCKVLPKLKKQKQEQIDEINRITHNKDYYQNLLLEYKHQLDEANKITSSSNDDNKLKKSAFDVISNKLTILKDMLNLKINKPNFSKFFGTNTETNTETNTDITVPKDLINAYIKIFDEFSNLDIAEANKQIINYSYLRNIIIEDSTVGTEYFLDITFVDILNSFLKIFNEWFSTLKAEDSNKVHIYTKRDAALQILEASTGIDVIKPVNICDAIKDGKAKCNNDDGDNDDGDNDNVVYTTTN